MLIKLRKSKVFYLISGGQVLMNLTFMRFTELRCCNAIGVIATGVSVGIIECRSTVGSHFYRFAHSWATFRIQNQPLEKVEKGELNVDGS